MGEAVEGEGEVFEGCWKYGYNEIYHLNLLFNMNCESKNLIKTQFINFYFISV